MIPAPVQHRALPLLVSGPAAREQAWLTPDRVHAGIEEIGVQLEEPYSILPLEEMCVNTTRMVLATEQEVPMQQQPLFSWESKVQRASPPISVPPRSGA